MTHHKHVPCDVQHAMAQFAVKNDHESDNVVVFFFIIIDFIILKLPL
jgi:hypothetical protein